MDDKNRREPFLRRVVKWEEETWVFIKQLFRLKGLLATVLLVAVLGWWGLEEYLAPALERLKADLIYLWDNATIAALLRVAAAYISRFGWKVIIIEVIKRIVIFIAVTKVAVWLIPWQTRLKIRWWLQEKKESLFGEDGKINRTKKFLSSPDMFGQFFGIALWVILTGIVVILFYSFFWLWTMILLGFIKLPLAFDRFFRYLGRKIATVLEKTGLRKFIVKLFRQLFRHITTPLFRFFPDWRKYFDQNEEKKRKQRVEQIRQIRVLIRMRKNKELWWQARGKRHLYRELREQHGHDVSLKDLLPHWLQRKLQKKNKKMSVLVLKNPINVQVSGKGPDVDQQSKQAAE